MRKIGLASLVLLGLILVGCGPAKQEVVEEVQPDETAFLISLEGNTEEDQAKFESIEFLEKQKVAAKRVTIPQRERDTGRMWFSYEWIPTVRLIKISRAPVTREWTDDPDTGTAVKAEKVRVESLDSVGFSVGATITCRIDEPDTATFLYYFGGKQLEEIIDVNIRGFCQQKLADMFGALKLEDCKKQKGQIFTKVREELRSEFEKMGVTVVNFGSSEGLTYENLKIQEAIDAQVQAEAEIEVEKNKKLAQDEANLRLIAKSKAEAQAELEAAQTELEAQKIKNQILVEKAQAESDAAKILSENKEGILLKLEVYEREKVAEAKVKAAENLKELRILPEGSGLLHGLDNKD